MSNLKRLFHRSGRYLETQLNSDCELRSFMQYVNGLINNIRDQAIKIVSLGQTYYILSGVKGDAQQRTRDLIEWMRIFKRYCVLLNLKSQYEIGNMLGKGNFAKVIEALFN